MTKYEAKVIGLYTGVVMGDFSDIHEYAEQLAGRPVFSHELASKELVNSLKELAKPDFLEICNNLSE